jgi:hypothetical protein
MELVKPKQPSLFQAYFPDKNYPYTVKYAPGSDNAFVKSNEPNAVYIDPAIDYAGVFPHEFEHQMDFKARQRYGMREKPDLTFWKDAANSVDVVPFVALDKFTGGVQNSVKKISKLFKEKTGKELPEFSRLWTADQQPLHELLAELSAVESVLNMDFTKDKNLRKEIFKNDEKLAQIYRSVTSGRQDRLDAKDLPPFTVQIQEPETQTQEPSTLKSIFQYINPFPDTTKD